MQSLYGAVSREYAIRTLTENGVSVSQQKGSNNGELVIAKGEVLEVRSLEDSINRKMVRNLSRKFEVPIHLFYN